MIYTVLDIETTGFNKLKDDILEVGYIRCTTNNGKNNVISAGVLYFYKPEFNIESPAQQVHGLQRSFLEQYADDFDKNLAALYTLVHEGVIVGKNNSRFDDEFIVSFLRKYMPGIKPALIDVEYDVQDSMSSYYREWYQRTYGGATKKLGKLSEYMHVLGLTMLEVDAGYERELGEFGRKHKHSGLYDAYMTLLCFRYIILKEEK